jgi:tRNA/rRNA methyltransferase
MMNFGFSELRIVAPRDGWPNQKALDMAVGAAGILEGAGIYDTLEEAIHDIKHLAVTTARSRDMVKPSATPKEFVANITNLKSAIAFGPERSGLTNDEVALADLIINIPVAEQLKSLNLAQAVAIVCYEVFVSTPSAVIPAQAGILATKQETIGMFHHLEEELEKSGFFLAPEKKPGMIRNIRNMLTKAKFTPQEIRTMRGIIRSLANPR